MVLTVRQRRGGHTETLHPVSAVLSDGTRAVWTVGEDLASFWRSACKPLQLLTSLAHLPADIRGRLTPADLAIGTSSHSGQPQHIAAVRGLLQKLEMDAAGLRCGAHLPMHEASARLVAVPEAIHNNCSGKHSFMLGAAVHGGFDPEYLPAAHPLQRENRARVEELSGTHTELAIDGCGVPTFHLPLSAMAHTWGRLAAARDDDAAAILAAMGAHPELVSGDERLDLRVSRAATEPLACKIGAEGLFAVALPARRLGIVVKVHSGNTDALAVAVRAVLDEVAPGVLRPDPWPWAVVKNVVGVEVGAREAIWG